jgi:membrane protein DedA with SNARE-associated domain
LSALTSLQVDAPLSYVIAVIALGVATAGSSDPRIALLIACAAAGAFLGDNLSYLIGRRFGPWAERRFFVSGKSARSRAWAERPCTDSACR